MNEINVSFPYESTGFDPGAEITFNVDWQFEESVDRIEVRLVWSTSGKGDTDLKVVKVIHVDTPANRDSQMFTLTLPWGPYSFSGKLISLTWGLEVIAFPVEESVRKEFTLAPQGREVLLRKS